MKLHTQETVIERGGNVDGEKAFQIKTTAKAFDILSSGLYTDNILAVVRELSCNAQDAHVAAGKADVPFEIHLPNKLEPWFHVKDFGVGLSHDQVMNLYTTYFESTKSDSNDFIGALGLGSKSPFSYAKSFEVTARWNGKRRLYSVFINEDGVPTIAKMGEIDTDEPNGIEVKVAVKPDDFYDFNTKLSTSLRWFLTKPTVVGAEHFSFPDLPSERLSGTGWHLLPRKSYHSTSKLTAVQGYVGYKVDTSHVKIDESLDHILENSQLVMFFDIGDLEVAASREEIRYDDRSVEALQRQIEVFENEVRGLVDDKVKALKGSVWDKTIAIRQLSKELFENDTTLRRFMKDYNGCKTLKKYVEADGKLMLEDTACWKVYSYTTGRGWGMNRKLVRNNVGTHIIPDKESHVFFLDQATGGIARLFEYYNSPANKVDRIYLITRVKHAYEMEKDKKGEWQKKFYTEKQYEKQLIALKKSFGGAVIKSVKDDTPKPVRDPREKNVPIYTFGKMVEKASSRHSYRTAYYARWDRVPTEFDYRTEGGLYFELQNRKHIHFNGTRVSWNENDIEEKLELILELVNKHHKTTYEIKDLFGVSASYVAKAKKYPQWVSLDDLVRPIIPTISDQVIHTRNWQATDDVIGIKRLLQHEDFLKRVNALDKKSFFRTHMQDMIDAAAGTKRLTTSQFDLLVQFDRMHGIQLYSRLEGKPLITKEELLDNYPMLAFAGDIRQSAFDVLFDYIELIDRSKK